MRERGPTRVEGGYVKHKIWNRKEFVTLHQWVKMVIQRCCQLEGCSTGQSFLLEPGLLPEGLGCSHELVVD